MPNLTNMLLGGGTLAALLVAIIMTVVAYSARSAGKTTTPAAGKPSAGANTGVSGTMKFWLRLFVFIMIAALIAFAISNGSIQEIQKATPLTIVLYISIAAAAVMLYLGIKEHLKAKESKGPKLLVTILAVFLLLFLAAYGLLGPDAVERARLDALEVGNNFANRIDTPANQPGSARDLLCGPTKFIDGTVSSRTVPLHFEAELSCSTLVPRKTAGAPVGISYNGEPMINWFSGDAPEYAGTVRTIDVVSLRGTPVYVKISFPR